MIRQRSRQTFAGDAEDLDPGCDLTAGERFRHVVVCSDYEPDELVDFVASSGEHENVRIGEGPDLSADLDAVSARESQIEDDQVRIQFANEGDRRQAIGGDLDPVFTAIFERSSDQLHKLGSVLDDQNRVALGVGHVVVHGRFRRRYARVDRTAHPPASLERSEHKYCGYGSRVRAIAEPSNRCDAYAPGLFEMIDGRSVSRHAEPIDRDRRP